MAAPAWKAVGRAGLWGALAPPCGRHPTLRQSSQGRASRWPSATAGGKYSLLELVSQPDARAGETGIVIAQVGIGHVRDCAIDGPALVESVAERGRLAEVERATVGIIE